MSPNVLISQDQGKLIVYIDGKFVTDAAEVSLTPSTASVVLNDGRVINVGEVRSACAEAKADVPEALQDAVNAYFQNGAGE